MHKIIRNVLLFFCLPMASMDNPIKQEFVASKGQIEAKQCPFCPEQMRELRQHLLSVHNIHKQVASECCETLTQFNAISKEDSYYKFAEHKCECNEFVTSERALQRHKKGKNCPLNDPRARALADHCIATSHVCECGQAFSFPALLKKHRSRICRLRPERTSNLKGSPKSESPNSVNTPVVISVEDDFLACCAQLPGL